MKLKINSLLFAAGVLLASCGGGEKKETVETGETFPAKFGRAGFRKIFLLEDLGLTKFMP